TGIIGAWLARHEGLRTLTHIRSQLAAGQLPGDQMIDALLILVAGALLVTPGVVTDAIGFLLLIPPARAWVRNHLKKRFKDKFVMTNLNHMDRPVRDDFIDVEVKSPDDGD
ncbi:MAG: FxsA family protein, partial [Planctomycetota bacterium]